MFSKNIADQIRTINTQDDSDLLPLDEIDFDDQYRKDIENYDLEWLARSIYQLSKDDTDYPTGLINKVVLSKQKNGRWLMDEGEMRLRAFMLLRKRYPDDIRWKNIPYSEAAKKIDERTKRDLRQLTANINRDGGSLFDKAKAINTLIEAGALDEVVEILTNSNEKATSKTAISRWKKIAQAPSEVENDVKELKIKDKTLIALLVDIYKKNKGRYFQLIIDHKGGLLKAPLYKSAQELWRFITKFNEPKSIVEKHIEQKENNANESAQAESINESNDNNSTQEIIKTKIKNVNPKVNVDSVSNNTNDVNDKDNTALISKMFIANSVKVLANGVIRFSGTEGMINITLPKNIKLEIVDAKEKPTKAN